MPIINEQIKSRAFLKEMYADGYFPRHLVDKGRQILLGLCERIEEQEPEDTEALYVLTHAATDEFNELAGEFEDAGSEIETVARDCIGEDFSFIAEVYGFGDADPEELIATRDW